MQLSQSFNKEIEDTFYQVCNLFLTFISQKRPKDHQHQHQALSDNSQFQRETENCAFSNLLFFVIYVKNYRIYFLFPWNACGELVQQITSYLMLFSKCFCSKKSISFQIILVEILIITGNMYMPAKENKTDCKKKINDFLCHGFVNGFLFQINILTHQIFLCSCFVSLFEECVVDLCVSAFKKNNCAL